MKIYLVPFTIVALILSAITFFVLNDYKIYPINKATQENLPRIKKDPVVVKNDSIKIGQQLAPLPLTYEIPSAAYVGQTFNNCGPATLSMVMSYFGKSVSQDVLRDQIRPYNNPQGGVDDKSLFADEFVKYAKQYGFEGIQRPDGDVTLLKTLIANDIPIIVRTWLHPNEDIGHFRIVRGYDENGFIQDDSYEGRGLRFDYATFEQMWKPFNHGYIVIFPKEKEEQVFSILGGVINERKAYLSSLQSNWNENDGYELFNLSAANYHLGDYQKAVAFFEKAQVKGLPSRMLWYQIEPIEAYLKIKNYTKVFELTDIVLNNGNLAFSELYFLRGQAYLEQGQKEMARGEFDKAIKYNKSFEEKVKAISL